MIIIGNDKMKFEMLGNGNISSNIWNIGQLVCKGMPSKKKSSYRRKSSFLGWEGVRKKGQISLVKEQKK